MYKDEGKVSKYKHPRNRVKTPYSSYRAKTNLSTSIFANNKYDNFKKSSGGGGRGKNKKQSVHYESNNVNYKGESNINIMRRVPSVMECNGVVVKSETMEKTTTIGVGKVTAFASFFKLTNSGPVNSLMENVISTIYRLGRGNTLLVCMAWLSHKGVLEAIKSCRRVLIIVNRENYATWGGGCMKTAYNDLPRFDEPLWKAFAHFNTPLCSLDKHLKNGKSSYAAVRAFGNPSNMSSSRAKNYSKFGASANISTGFEHCKYFVFFKKMPVLTENGETRLLDCPNSVMTCSSNMTKTSETHHENAILIEDNPKIAEHYMLDHNATFMSSVPVYSKSRTQTPINKFN